MIMNLMIVELKPDYQGDSYILRAIGEDWKKTGRCDFAMAKETFMLALASAFFMRKNSPYTEYFNRGLIIN